MVTLNCAFCGEEFERASGEANRAKRLGRPSYCTQSCATRGARKNGGSQGASGWKIPRDQLCGGRKRDEFTPFRMYYNALGRRKPCMVTLQHLKDQWDAQKGICPLTGWELDLPARGATERGPSHPRRASLDRIDSSKGYEPGNIRWVSAMANYAKSNWTDADVVEFARAVTAHHTPS